MLNTYLHVHNNYAFFDTHIVVYNCNHFINYLIMLQLPQENAAATYAPSLQMWAYCTCSVRQLVQHMKSHTRQTFRAQVKSSVLVLNFHACEGASPFIWKRLDLIQTLLECHSLQTSAFPLPFCVHWRHLGQVSDPESPRWESSHHGSCWWSGSHQTASGILVQCVPAETTDIVHNCKLCNTRLPMQTNLQVVTNNDDWDFAVTCISHTTYNAQYVRT